MLASMQRIPIATVMYLAFKFASFGFTHAREFLCLQCSLQLESNRMFEFATQYLKYREVPIYETNEKSRSAWRPCLVSHSDPATKCHELELPVFLNHADSGEVCSKNLLG